MPVEEKEMNIKYLKKECYALLCRCEKAEAELQEVKESKQFWFMECMKTERELDEVKAKLAEFATKDDINLSEGDETCPTA